MSDSTSYCRKTGAGLYALALAGTFLLMAALVWLMRENTETATPFAARSAERVEIMKQFQLDNAPLTNDYAWADQTRGVVRIPLERAKELFLSEWQNNPAAGRSNLLARAAKAFAPLPKPPEKKNEYE